MQDTSQAVDVHPLVERSRRLHTELAVAGGAPPSVHEVHVKQRRTDAPHSARVQPRRNVLDRGAVRIIGRRSGQPASIISARNFTGGSAKVKVTGSTQIDAEVPINTQASISDGDHTWIQYGASGSPTPNALITLHDGELGFNVGKGKFSVTAGIMEGGEAQCSGKAEVTPTLVTGRYTCPNIDSYDAATRAMGKVSIEISFTAKS